MALELDKSMPPEGQRWTVANTTAMKHAVETISSFTEVRKNANGMLLGEREYRRHFLNLFYTEEQIKAPPLVSPHLSF